MGEVVVFIFQWGLRSPTIDIGLKEPQVQHLHISVTYASVRVPQENGDIYCLQNSQFLYKETWTHCPCPSALSSSAHPAHSITPPREPTACYIPLFSNRWTVTVGSAPIQRTQVEGPWLCPAHSSSLSRQLTIHPSLSLSLKWCFKHLPTCLVHCRRHLSH